MKTCLCAMHDDLFKQRYHFSIFILHNSELTESLPDNIDYETVLLLRSVAVPTGVTNLKRINTLFDENA